MSNVYATQAIAEAHIAELHRVAAERRVLADYRRTRSTARPSPIGSLALRKTWATASAWISARAAKASAEPVCCPA